eukprot:TRINITY_DN13121_c0_g1_i1.p1 TRINITY_DN13121_c0_g1~~TRINITY_DN13121_c0_g1_i1.p1  ORF type:complete len:187 (-),score=48.60 TRINITY_DN13121_c0_g1_i1:438-998(-)
MRWLLSLIFSAGLVLLAEGSARGRRETDACKEVHDEFVKCTEKAYADYQTDYSKGDDGKPDWMARKSCNYMTAAVEDCGNKLIGDCKTEKEVTDRKDEQLKNVLVKLKSSIADWDSDKCPAIKAHVERMKAAEAAKSGDGTTLDGDAPAPAPETGEQNAEPSEEPTDSATNITASVLFVLVLTIFI